MTDVTKANDAEVPEAEQTRRSSHCYAALAGRILDMVSYRGKLRDGTEYREGMDTIMHGVDAEATEIVKEWAKENIGAVVSDVIMSDEFLNRFAAAFAAAFADTPLPSTIEAFEEFHARDGMASSIAAQIEGGGYPRTD